MDLDDLLAEIKPGLPCGQDAQGDPLFLELKKKLQGIRRHSKDENGELVQVSEQPKWREVQDDALRMLKRSRHLQVIVYYIRAAAHVEGYAGLRDGLALLQGAIDRYWPTIYPEIDPDDGGYPLRRINILKALNAVSGDNIELKNQDTLLYALETAPLAGGYSLRQINESGLNGDGLDYPEIQAAFISAAHEDRQAISEAIGASLDALGKIEEAVNLHVPKEEPKLIFAALRNRLDEAVKALDKLTQSCGVAESSAAGEQDEASPAQQTEPGEAVPRKENPPHPPHSAPSNFDGIRDRQDVIRALGAICDYYHRQEPASPIPILLKRCEGLVFKGFLEILEDLAPDGLAQFRVFSGKSETQPDSESNNS